MDANTHTGVKKRIKSICWKTVEKIVCLVTYLSPKLNTQLRYKMAYGVFPNLKNPSSFSEKLCWLKLNKYMKDPLVIQCADKLRVREYLKEKGCETLLNELFYVYDSADQIDWNALPEQFVLKWNFGAGKNLICKNKEQYTSDQVVSLFREWGKDRCWLPYSEMQYKYIPKKIICERFLQDDLHGNALPDYKVYCFHGEPLITLVMLDRGSEVKAQFYDQEWNALENPKYKKPEENIEKPACYQQMLDSARRLSKPFPFVRVDFYVVNGQLFFGELTFTPAGGLYMSQTKVNGKDMTDFLNVG